MLTKKITLVLLVLTLSIAVASCEPVKRQSGENTPSRQEVSEQKLPEQNQSVNALYSIIKDTRMKPFKRSVDVRLSQKVSEGTLGLIAQEIKRQDPTNYDRTFIVYYLPGMQVGGGGWATSHFNPTLNVRILGLSEEYQTKITASLDQSRDVVGVWFDEIIGRIITIYHKNGKLLIEMVYKDGSKSEEEMIESQISSGRKFVAAENPRFGEYWLLKSDGTLQVFDDEGLIRTYIAGAK